jgi:histone acetyltransferase
MDQSEESSKKRKIEELSPDEKKGEETNKEENPDVDASARDPNNSISELNKPDTGGHGGNIESDEEKKSDDSKEKEEKKEAGKKVNDSSTNEDAKEGGNSNDKEDEVMEEAKDEGEEKKDSEQRKNGDDIMQVEKDTDYKQKDSDDKNPYDSLRWIVVKNDGRPESLIKLVALKSLFSKQLPKMPRAYIARLVFDRRHTAIAILSDDPAMKDTDEEVIGSICYRAFPEMRFAEIAFCAVNANHQVKVGVMRIRRSKN